MRNRYDTAGLDKVMPDIFERADLDHTRACVSGALEPAGFTVSPAALRLVREAAGIAGESQGALVSIGIALAVEMFCRRDGLHFRALLDKRLAKALGGQK